MWQVKTHWQRLLASGETVVNMGGSLPVFLKWAASHRQFPDADCTHQYSEATGQDFHVVLVASYLFVFQGTVTSVPEWKNHVDSSVQTLAAFLLVSFAMGLEQAEIRARNYLYCWAFSSSPGPLSPWNYGLLIGSLCDTLREMVNKVVSSSIYLFPHILWIMWHVW